MALVKSEHRYARIASTKVNRILPIVRGREVGDSLDLLKTLPNRAARMVEAVIQTAAANAAEAGVRNVEKLKIAEAVANCGPMYKRIRPGARGRRMLRSIVRPTFGLKLTFLSCRPLWSRSLRL
jgi:large subunit ribosomal protein L22